ncbi:MAG: lysylphosphatidylglycerol synthase transmembrane domain-containing protein, partial [Anaerolineales bacterium]
AFSGQLWMILRSQSHPLPFFSLVRYWLAGFAAGYFTPASQIGSGTLQIYYLQRRKDVPVTTATTAVVLSEVLERVGRALFLLLGIIALLQLLPWSDLSNKLLGTVALGSLALPVSYLIAVRRGWRPLFSILTLLPAKLRDRPNYRKLLAVIAESEVQLIDFCRKKPKAMAIGVSLSLLSWTLISLETWLAVSFLGLIVSPIEALAVSTAAQLALLTPLPGGLGALEASLVAVFVALGHPAAAAAGFVLLIRVRDLALGGLGLWPGAGGRSLRLGEADHVGGLAPKPRAMKVVYGGWDQIHRRWMGQQRIKSEQEPAAK